MTEYDSFVAAFFAMQRELPDVDKSSVAEIPGQKPREYANAKTLYDAAMPLFGKFGFIWVCAPTLDDSKPVLLWELTHVSHTAANPQQRTGIYPIFGDNKPQALGAAITYAMRNALRAVVGLTPDKEEDAEGKPVGRVVSRKPKAEPKPPADPDQVPGVPLPGEPVDRMTQPQQRAIFAQLRELGIADAERFTTVNPILTAAGHQPVTTFADLTVTTGKVIYDGLKREIDARSGGSDRPA